MPQLAYPPARAPATDPRLARLLWQWLALGALAVLLFPAARGGSQLLGSLPFWLLLAPATALLTLHRHALAAAWRARLVRATPRRRQRSQARKRAQVRNLTPVFSRARRGACAPGAAGIRP